MSIRLDSVLSLVLERASLPCSSVACGQKLICYSGHLVGSVLNGICDLFHSRKGLCLLLVEQHQYGQRIIIKRFRALGFHVEPWLRLSLPGIEYFSLTAWGGNILRALNKTENSFSVPCLARCLLQCLCLSVRSRDAGAESLVDQA